MISVNVFIFFFSAHTQYPQMEENFSEDTILARLAREERRKADTGVQWVSELGNSVYIRGTRSRSVHARRVGMPWANMVRGLEGSDGSSAGGGEVGSGGAHSTRLRRGTPEFRIPDCLRSLTRNTTVGSRPRSRIYDDLVTVVKVIRRGCSPRGGGFLSLLLSLFYSRSRLFEAIRRQIRRFAVGRSHLDGFAKARA